MIRDAAHAFAQSELQPRVIDAFANEVDAPELFPLMGRAGLLGATVPEEYGGAGADYVAYGLIAREIERVEFGLPLDGERSVEPRDVPDPCLRIGGAATANTCPASPAAT